jgi:hypothetical protein
MANTSSKPTTTAKPANVPAPSVPGNQAVDTGRKDAKGNEIWSPAREVQASKPLPSASITVTTNNGKTATLTRSPYVGNYQDYDQAGNKIGEPYRLEEGTKTPVTINNPNAPKPGQEGAAELQRLQLINEIQQFQQQYYAETAQTVRNAQAKVLFNLQPNNTQIDYTQRNASESSVPQSAKAQQPYTPEPAIMHAKGPMTYYEEHGQYAPNYSLGFNAAPEELNRVAMLQKNQGHYYSFIMGELASFGTGAVVGAENLLFHPFQTAEQTVELGINFVTNPAGTAKEQAAQFMQNPAGNAGRFAGQFALAEGLSKGLKSVSKANEPEVIGLKSETQRTASENQIVDFTAYEGELVQKKIIGEKITPFKGVITETIIPAADESESFAIKGIAATTAGKIKIRSDIVGRGQITEEGSNVVRMTKSATKQGNLPELNTVTLSKSKFNEEMTNSKTVNEIMQPAKNQAIKNFRTAKIGISVDNTIMQEEILLPNGDQGVMSRSQGAVLETSSQKYIKSLAMNSKKAKTSIEPAGNINGLVSKSKLQKVAPAKPFAEMELLKQTVIENQPKIVPEQISEGISQLKFTKVTIQQTKTPIQKQIRMPIITQRQNISSRMAQNNKVNLEYSTKSDKILKNKFNNMNKQAQEPNLKFAQLNNSIYDTSSESIIENKSKLDQAQKNQLAEFSIQQTSQKMISKPAIISAQINFTPQKEFPKPIFGKQKSSKHKPEEASFKTFVRRRGVFKQVASSPTQEEAINAGAFIVRNTAAASFKVSGPGVSQNPLNTLKNFYGSKREPGVFIQKSSNRISTMGEKAEITYKGIMASKINRKKKGIWG